MEYKKQAVRFDVSSHCPIKLVEAMSELKSTGELHIDEYQQGMANMKFGWNTPLILNLADTDIARSWKLVVLHWHYPHDDLTLIIETPFTQQQQQYAISIDMKQLKMGTSRAYRIIAGKEIDLATSDCQRVQECDSNYQVILKLYATPASAYVAIIKYDVIEK